MPVEDDADGEVSLIKRHPPRRLRKTMEEQLGDPLPLTQEVLEEKVQLANERRNQVKKSPWTVDIYVSSNFA